MTVTTSPFFGIQYGWETGQAGWGDPVNTNLKVLSFLDKGAVDDFVSSLPGSPTTGSSYVLTTDNLLYVRFAEGWVFITPQNGMEVTKLSDGTKQQWNGSIWTEVLSSTSLANSSNTSKGAALVGNGVISVKSVADLLLQPRRVDLQYLVKGYYSGTEVGGGQFFWDNTSILVDNGGTVFQVPGVTTGRFIRKFDGGYIHTQEFGIDHTGVVSCGNQLNAMIQTGFPIWLDDGILTIKETVFLDNSSGDITIHGTGTLSIVSDSSFNASSDSFMTADAAITMRAPISTGPTRRLDLRFKTAFVNSDATKPHTPFRFVHLRDSVIDLDCTCSGSGAVTQTNLPDFYYDNRRVRIRGRYVLTHSTVTNAGGMWVRDVGLAGADNTTYFSENLEVEDGTRIENNGNDEALSFFNPSGGTIKNSKVGAASIKGAGLGLSVLEFGSASRSQELLDVQLIGTKVTVDRLRINQPVVKFDKTAPKAFGLEVIIAGFDDLITSGAFYAGIRNSTQRTNPEYPEVINCRVLMGATTLPASETRAYDGPMMATNCGNAALPGGVAFNYGAKNGNTILGGRYTSASTFTFDTCGSVRDALPGNASYNNVTYKRGLELHGVTSVTPDGSGQFTINHTFGVNPSFATASLENNNANDVVVVSRSSGSVVFRIVTRSAGTPVTSGTFTAVWSFEV